MRAFTTGVLAGLIFAGGAALAADKRAERQPSFPKSGRIHGYLVDSAGQGLRGMVAICSQDGRELEIEHSVALNRGRFEFGPLLPGTYLLRVKTVGPVVTDLVPPPDVRVTVRANQVERPHLVAPGGPRTP